MMGDLFTTILFQGLPWKALALSLVLPGAGELSLGYPKAARPFLGLEGASWTAFFTLNRYTQSLRQEYVIFAYQYANANFHRQDEDYWKAVEFYPSRDAYIEALWIEARSYFPSDYERQFDYVRSHDPGGSWAWDQQDHWYRFQELRQRYRALEDWTTVTLGVLVGNRIASVINVFLLSRTQGRVGVAFHRGLNSLTAQLRFTW